MKLVRVGPPGSERPARLEPDGSLRDLGGFLTDVDGPALATNSLRQLADLPADQLPLLETAGLRIGVPVARPGTVVGIGLNYADHARETGATIPVEPIVFLKASRTVVGPHDDVLIPRRSTKTDYEVELAVVIGATARYLDSAADSAACIAGYAVSNDVSEREFQLERGGQWDKGKSCETFNPLGPWLVTADEVPDPQALALSLSVNGEVRQRSSTAEMVFGVHHLVWYLSQFMVLEPGDVINTGTPAGVALGSDPPRYLRDGDEVEAAIAGLGSQRARCRQA